MHTWEQPVALLLHKLARQQQLPLLICVKMDLVGHMPEHKH